MPNSRSHGTGNGNGWMNKILAGAATIMLAGAVTGSVIAWGQVQVQESRVDAAEREAKTAAEKLDRFDGRLQRIEREVVEANAKLDTMLRNQSIERKP